MSITEDTRHILVAVHCDMGIRSLHALGVIHIDSLTLLPINSKQTAYLMLS